MTFTAIARCPETGKLGVATATRSLAVGARVPHVSPNLGAVAIMAIADGRLGTTAKKLLDLGYKAPNVIDALVASEPNPEYRQLGVIDADGFAAARTTATTPATTCATISSRSAMCWLANMCWTLSRKATTARPMRLSRSG